MVYAILTVPQARKETQHDHCSSGTRRIRRNDHQRQSLHRRALHRSGLCDRRTGIHLSERRVSVLYGPDLCLPPRKKRKQPESIPSACMRRCIAKWPWIWEPGAMDSVCAAADSHERIRRALCPRFAGWASDRLLSKPVFFMWACIQLSRIVNQKNGLAETFCGKSHKNVGYTTYIFPHSRYSDSRWKKQEAE